MQKLVKISFVFSTLFCLLVIILILSSYFLLKPNLPEISLVDEDNLQMPLKVFTSDGVLIGMLN